MSPLTIAGIAVSPGHCIDGERVGSDETFELFSPIDMSPLGRIAEGSAAHVDAAISAAQRAFPAWAALSPSARREHLLRFATEIERRAESLCVLESNDAGVLYSRMRHGVAPRAVQNISFFAEHALSLQDRRIETEQATHLVRHDPAGVVAIITPWNAPLMLTTWKLGPALAEAQSALRAMASAAESLERESKGISGSVDRAADATDDQLSVIAVELRSSVEAFNRALDRFRDPAAALLGPSKVQLGPGER